MCGVGEGMYLVDNKKYLSFRGGKRARAVGGAGLGAGETCFPNSIE